MTSHENMKRMIDALLSLEKERTLKRMEGVECPERRLVAPTAERAERQGAAEDSREGRRVAPVTAEAAILRAVEWNEQAAATHRLNASLALAELKFAHARFHMSREIQHYEDARELGELLPKPASEADAPASTPTGEPSTEATPSPPTDDERSGRHNESSDGAAGCGPNSP
jgi:hypothetical protein